MDKPAPKLNRKQATRTVDTLRSVFDLIDEMTMECPHCGEPKPRWRARRGGRCYLSTIPQLNSVNECQSCGEAVTVQTWRVPSYGEIRALQDMLGARR